MRWLGRLFVGGVFLTFVGMAWLAIVVRITPITAEMAHFSSYPSGLGHIAGRNAHTWRTRQAGDGAAQMALLDKIIRATPRTTMLAGSVEEGLISYVTYSKVWQFPDITNLERNMGLIEGGPPVLSMRSAAYYGASDLGVNERRMREWLILFEAQVGG